MRRLLSWRDCRPCGKRRQKSGSAATCSQPAGLWATNTPYGSSPPHAAEGASASAGIVLSLSPGNGGSNARSIRIADRGAATSGTRQNWCCHAGMTGFSTGGATVVSRATGPRCGFPASERYTVAYGLSGGLASGFEQDNRVAVFQRPYRLIQRAFPRRCRGIFTFLAWVLTCATRQPFRESHLQCLCHPMSNASPSSRIGAVFDAAPVVDQRVIRKGLHYSG